MIYEFECEKCGNIEDINAPMKDGPHKKIVCPTCGAFMNRLFCANFILLGEGWAGKDLKKKDYEGGKAREEVEHRLNQDKSDQKLVKDILQVRRQGRKATEQYKKDNPTKWKDYQKALKRGVRAK